MVNLNDLRLKAKSHPMGGIFYTLSLPGLGNVASCMVRPNPQTGGLRLFNFIVDPAYRNQGIANAFMNTLMNMHGSNRPNELVANPYKDAIPREKLHAFYKKFGFQPVRQLENNRLLMFRKDHPEFDKVQATTRVDVFENFTNNRPTNYVKYVTKEGFVSPKVSERTRRIIQRLQYRIMVKVNRLDIDNAFFIYLDGSVYNRPNGRAFFVSDPYDAIENVVFLNKHHENEQKVLKAGFIKVKEYKGELVALVSTAFESYAMSDAFQTLARIMKRRKIDAIKVYAIDKYGRFDRFSFGAILDENKSRVLNASQLLQANKRAVHLPGFM